MSVRNWAETFLSRLGTIVWLSWTAMAPDYARCSATNPSATAPPDGEPSARMVILRGRDEGLVFFTDFTSAKGGDLAVNPRAAALLHWLAPVHRQVRVTGPVAKVTDDEADRYWATRPPGSRRSASASHQSTVVASR